MPGGGDQAAEAEGWPASLAAFPLGQWIADARRTYARAGMSPERVAQLDALGMVWSHYDVAWDEGLAAARGWAQEHGHLLAPTDATHQGYRVGLFLKNARAAARRAEENEQRRAEGLPVQTAAGALSQERRERLGEIDPAWCPAWPIDWQRCFHLVRQHLQAGGQLPTSPGVVVHQGEDLGRWVRAQQLGFDKLTGAVPPSASLTGFKSRSITASRARAPPPEPWTTGSTKTSSSMPRARACSRRRAGEMRVARPLSAST
ncbi:helicase associated domain-containing protein [Streptomyces viridochromogenes]|uniref:helicase associated domain-containing protein n=1 Tax=Streptomyces viridochromogenes TaxID=1938 RepID=UPI003CD0B32F